MKRYALQVKNTDPKLQGLGEWRTVEIFYSEQEAKQKATYWKEARIVTCMR